MILQTTEKEGICYELEQSTAAIEIKGKVFLEKSRVLRDNKLIYFEQNYVETNATIWRN